MAALPFDSAEMKEQGWRLYTVMAKEATDAPDLGGIPRDDEVAETLQETQGDLRRNKIMQEITSMNDERKDALVALFWVGRGDAEPEEREETKALARQQQKGLVSRYLLGQTEVGAFMTKGLEAILEDGVD